MNVTAAAAAELPPQTFVSFSVFAAAALAVSCLVFHRYGSFRRTSVYVVVAVLLGWWLSSLIVFVIPMDVASSVYVACMRDSTSRSCPSILANPPLLSFLNPAKDQAIYWIWRAIYWSAYVSIWAVYPVLTSYSSSPEFKQRQRWWRALKENLIYYGLYAVVGVALMVWVGVRQTGMTFQALLATMILMGNTFGLFLVIVLLSIGLVRIPRNLWRMSRRHVMLKHYMWHIGDAHVEYEQSKRALMTVLK